MSLLYTGYFGIEAVVGRIPSLLFTNLRAVLAKPNLVRVMAESGFFLAVIGGGVTLGATAGVTPGDICVAFFGAIAFGVICRTLGVVVRRTFTNRLATRGKVGLVVAPSDVFRATLGVICRTSGVLVCVAFVVIAGIAACDPVATSLNGSLFIRRLNTMRALVLEPFRACRR